MLVPHPPLTFEDPASMLTFDSVLFLSVNLPASHFKKLYNRIVLIKSSGFYPALSCHVLITSISQSYLKRLKIDCYPNLKITVHFPQLIKRIDLTSKLYPLPFLTAGERRFQVLLMRIYLIEERKIKFKFQSKGNCNTLPTDKSRKMTMTV